MWMTSNMTTARSFPLNTLDTVITDPTSGRVTEANYWSQSFLPSLLSSTHFMPRTMSNSMSDIGHGDNSSGQAQNDEDLFTFGPSADSFLDPLWTSSSAMYPSDNHLNMTMLPQHQHHHQQQQQQQSTMSSHYGPSSYDNYAWGTLPYNVNNTMPAPSSYPATAYSPDSGVHTLSPYSTTQSRALSPKQASPSSSELVLSPYAASSPPTPGSAQQQYQMLPADNTQPLLLTSNTETEARRLYTHREELQMFRDVVTRFAGGRFGPFVPQPMYKPHTNSDRKRYVEEVELEEPIYFTTDHGECGILLSDALRARVKTLKDRDQTVFEGRGPSVSIRLEWPGYRQWSRQIPTKDFRSPPGPITKAKLAKNVAKCVQRFIDERKNQPLEEETDVRWKIGQPHITLDDIILVSIHHVSLGSWQPHLRLRRPFAL